MDEHVSVVPVEIKNWPEPPAKQPYVKNTTLKTYIVDPASSIGLRSVQISDYEPRRVRMAIQVIDSPVVLVVDAPPTVSPDTSTASSAPSGLYLPVNTADQPYEFFGPDAFWLNSLTAVTRVSVTKEYC